GARTFDGIAVERPDSPPLGIGCPGGIGRRTTDWLEKGVVKQHRKLGTTLNTLIADGFTIRHVEEWSPNEDELHDNPD
ncbi:hypothetical protein ACC706_38760, partial [Rhizobium johnstonii]